MLSSGPTREIIAMCWKTGSHQFNPHIHHSEEASHWHYSPRLGSTSALPSPVCPNTKHLTTRFCGQTGDNLNPFRSHYKTYWNYFPTCSSSLSNSSLLFLCRKTARDSSLNFWSKTSSSAGSWKHCGILIFSTWTFKTYTSSKYS